MADDEGNGDEERRQLDEEIREALGVQPSSQGVRLSEGEARVLRRAARIHESLVRPPGDGPAPGSFPSGKNIFYHDIEPREVRRQETVTIVGKNLYGVKDVRIGGARASLVKRGERLIKNADDEDELFATLEVFIAETARDGRVRVNGERVDKLDLKLVEDDDNRKGS